MKAVAVFPKERAVRVIEDHPEPGAAVAALGACALLVRLPHAARPHARK